MGYHRTQRVVPTGARTGVYTALVHAGQVPGALRVNCTLRVTIRRAPDVARRARTDRRAARGATYRVGTAWAWHARVAVLDDNGRRLVYSSERQGREKEHAGKNNQHQTNAIQCRANTQKTTSTGKEETT